MSPRDTEVVIFADTRGMVHHEIFRGILTVELGARVLIAESCRQTDAVKVMD